MGRLLLPDLVPLLLNANVGLVAGSKTGGIGGRGGGRKGEGSGRDEGGKTRRRGRNGNKIIGKAEMGGSGEALSRLRDGQKFVFNSIVLPDSKQVGEKKGG